MTSPQEGRYTKIAAIAGVIAVMIAVLAWIYPFTPRPDTPAKDTERATVPFESSRQPPPPNSDENQPSDSKKPLTEGISSAGGTSGEEGDMQPHTNRLNLAQPERVCNVPETATLRPDAPVRVASGLAVLSVRTAREGSEPYLTFGIASDRDMLTKGVLGAPARFHFKTSLGTYFVNVTEADLRAGAMTVQVGCEAKGNTP